MITAFKAYCQDFRLEKKRLLIACSGGLDSVVLAHLCFKSDFTFALAHCNFQLRGAESDADALFVQTLANDLDCDYFVEQFSTENYAKEQKISIQMAARDLRYQWFENIRVAKNFDAILTAHHLDDTIETFLINSSRGTGLAGLTGIPAQQNFILDPY